MIEKEETCAGPTIPKVGASWLYEVQGTPATTGSESWAIAGFGPEDPIPNGSRLHVRLLEDSAFNYLNHERSAVQAEYRLTTQAGFDRVVFREWMDSQDLRLFAVESPWIRVDEDGERRQSHLSTRHEGYIPLMGAPIYWSNLSGEEVFAPRLKGMGLPLDGQWRYSIETDRAGCIFHARYELHGKLGTQQDTLQEGHLVFNDGAAMPNTIRAGHRTNPAFQADLLEYVPGDGAQLPDFMRMEEPSGQSVIQPMPHVDGFPQDGGVFPTSIAQALDEIEASDSSDDWFERSDIVPYHARHFMGAAESNIVDEWLIGWIRSDGETRAFLVERYREPPLTSLGSEFGVYQVNSPRHLGTGLEYFTPGPMVSLDDMAEMHRSVKGVDPELLVCWFEVPACGIGTHAAAGNSPIQEGASGGAFFWPMGFHLEHGTYAGGTPWHTD